MRSQMRAFANRGKVGRRRGRGRLIQRGQSMVEFALVLFVTLLVALGFLQIAFVYAQTSEAGNVGDSLVMAAARYGGHTPELDTMADEIVRHSWLQPDKFSWNLETRGRDGNVQCSGAGCACEYGQHVVIQIRYEWSIRYLISFGGTYATEKAQVCWRGHTPGG